MLLRLPRRKTTTASAMMRKSSSATVSFIYRGLAATAGSETFGNLNLQGGHNNVTLTPGSGGGTVSVTANGNLTLAPRATLQVTSATLGAASKMFINGTMPAADATGILSRVVGSTDFLTYNATTGLTPYTGYATDFTTAGTNVAVTAAASVPNSINVNAIKSTGTFATTITAGQTLGVTSGMLLNISGTRTYTGGTIAFGSNPGVLFAGTTGSGGFTISSALTGTCRADQRQQRFSPLAAIFPGSPERSLIASASPPPRFQPTHLAARSKYAAEPLISRQARRSPVRALSRSGCPRTMRT